MRLIKHVDFQHVDHSEDLASSWVSEVLNPVALDDAKATYIRKMQIRTAWLVVVAIIAGVAV